MYKQYIKWEIRVRHRRRARNLWKIVAPNTFAVVVHVNAGMGRKMITNLYLSIQRFLVSLWLLPTMSIVSKFHVSLPEFNYKIRRKKVFSFIKSFHFNFIECDVFVQLAIIWIQFCCHFNLYSEYNSHSSCGLRVGVQRSLQPKSNDSCKKLKVTLIACIAFNSLFFVWNLSFLPNYIPFWISSYFN